MNGTGVIGNGDAIALQASNGQYVVAEGGGGGVVNANRSAIGPWETFAIILGGTIANSLPTSAAQADSFFKLQYYHPKYNPNGSNSSTNCGPASLAMVLKTLGREPNGISIETSIDHARYLMFPNDPRVTIRENVRVLNTDSALSSSDNIATGIRTAGGTPEAGSGWDTLNQKLSEGKPVISYGYLDDNWRRQFPARVGSGNIGHINAILGRTPAGGYIVADPMHEGGPVEMTRERLAVFYSRTSGGSPSFTAFKR
ncbi:MAG: hypothetical protein Fur006_51020 [Coleofasciculaceae cyanobacterium]